jgi:hypothetical protein
MRGLHVSARGCLVYQFRRDAGWAVGHFLGWAKTVPPAFSPFSYFLFFLFFFSVETLDFKIA